MLLPDCQHGELILSSQRRPVCASKTGSKFVRDPGSEAGDRIFGTIEQLWQTGRATHHVGATEGQVV